MQIVSLHNLCTEQTKLYLLIAECLQVQAVTAAIMVYLNRDIWCTEISQVKLNLNLTQIFVKPIWLLSHRCTGIYHQWKETNPGQGAYLNPLKNRGYNIFFFYFPKNWTVISAAASEVFLFLHFLSHSNIKNRQIIVWVHCRI